MQLSLSPEALELARKKGGVMALDFIPPLTWRGRAEVSVDTYLKGKNLRPYGAVEYGGVKILVAPSLVRWAAAVHVGVREGFFSKSFEVEAEHRHGATCEH